VTEPEDRNRPTAGEVEERTATVEVVDRRVRGLIPYSTRSRDMGGWFELVEPGAFRNTDLSELRAVIDHQGVPLGRYPQTLEVSDQPDGLHWSLDPPKSRADVIEAIERGDMRAGSWRMVVGRDEWRGDVRHVHEIRELKDVTIVGAEEPAYGEAARVEYRTHNDGGSAAREEGTMPPQSEDGAAENRSADENRSESSDSSSTVTASAPAVPATTTTSTATTAATGSLKVEDRASAPRRGLADEFRSRGWPSERATLGYDEYRRATVEFRTLTVSGAVDDVNQTEGSSAPLGYDTRYAFPAFGQVAVGRDVTSVHVLQQTARSLATAANVVRPLETVSTKPETSSTVDDVVVSLKQVASVSRNIPNIMLEQPAFRTVIEQDLRHALDGGLDKLILDAIAASGFQPPGTDPLLVSIRKARTVVESNGYAPNVVILRPQDSEGLDVLVSGISGAVNDYVFPPATPAPPTIFGMQVRISKLIPAPAVADSQALGKLYVSPISLASFEEDAGSTNKSTVRLEGHAAFGTERQAAAVRIAAS
jgi:HK97 family phage prohead protease